MMKFREKWFWALCLAVLVHVGVFFIFYLNTHQADSVETADTSISKNEPAAINNVNTSEKVYTTTVTSLKTSDDSLDDTLDNISKTDDRPEVSELTNNDKQATSTTNKEASSSQAATNSPQVTTNRIDEKPKSLSATSKESAQVSKKPTQNEQTPNTQIDRSNQSMVADTNDNLEELRSNAGLLDIDVPTQKSNVKIDKDYLSAKSEVEDINNQLSAAINEVKKRNQQKIDAQQQLRSEAGNKDSQNLMEDSN